MLGCYGGTEFATPEPRSLGGARRCASPATTPARCPACRPGTTSSAARSTSSGSPGARWRSGKTRSPRACRDAGVVTAADQRPPAPLRDRRRELPRRLHRLGLPARPRGRRLEDPGRSQLGRRAVVRPRRACPMTTAAAGSAARPTFPGPQTLAAGARWIEENAGAPRTLLPVRRRVRPARAVRHARALRQPVRPGLGRPAPDLAALCGRRR